MDHIWHKIKSGRMQTAVNCSKGFLKVNKCATYYRGVALNGNQTTQKQFWLRLFFRSGISIMLINMTISSIMPIKYHISKPQNSH